MPYIDKVYYETIFKGTMPAVANDLDIYIDRASDVIDMIINYKIKGDLTDQIPFIEQQVKKATATQVLHFVINGGYEDLFSGSSELKSEKIGSFSYSKDGNASVKLVSNMAIDYLVPTGLLYAGLDQNVYQGIL